MLGLQEVKEPKATYNPETDSFEYSDAAVAEIHQWINKEYAQENDCDEDLYRRLNPEVAEPSAVQAEIIRKAMNYCWLKIHQSVDLVLEAEDRFEKATAAGEDIETDPSLLPDRAFIDGLQGYEVVAMVKEVVREIAASIDFGHGELEDYHRRINSMAPRLAQKEYRITLSSKAGAIDEMTGLYKKPYFEERLKKTANAGDSFVVASLDGNKFKKFNTLGGHEFGDDIIRAIANTLREVLRREDVIARFGGDEFEVLALVQDAKSGGIVIEKIFRAGVDSLKGVTVRTKYETLLECFKNYQTLLSLPGIDADQQMAVELFQSMVKMNGFKLGSLEEFEASMKDFGIVTSKRHSEKGARYLSVLVPLSWTTAGAFFNGKTKYEDPMESMAHADNALTAIKNKREEQEHDFAGYGYHDGEDTLVIVDRYSSEASQAIAEKTLAQQMVDAAFNKAKGSVVDLAERAGQRLDKLTERLRNWGK